MKKEDMLKPIMHTIMAIAVILLIIGLGWFILESFHQVNCLMTHQDTPFLLFCTKYHILDILKYFSVGFVAICVCAIGSAS
jgi:hypothetical protein